MMRWENVKMIRNIYGRLCDQQSRDIFEARLTCLISGNLDGFTDWFLAEHKELHCPELEEYEKGSDSTEYILFGTGCEGKKAYKILKACHKKMIGWSDNNRVLWGTDIEGMPVIMPGRLIENYQDKTIIITVKYNLLEIYQQLLMIGFPRDKIIIPKNGFLLAFCGEQYFDMFSAEKNEIFVDAGSLDGESSVKFVKWCGGDENYEKIYAFEPDENCWGICEKSFKESGIEKLEFIKKAVWKRSDILSFQGIGIGSSNIRENSSIYKVPVVSIDEILMGKQVTFIKLDVEGSEMAALEGASESIRRWKPKLAVRVYHKPEDLWTLASYIIELNPNYNLYLRHYTTCNYETVLYAI